MSSLIVRWSSFINMNRKTKNNINKVIIDINVIIEIMAAIDEHQVGSG